MKTVRLLFSDDMARAIVQGRKTVTRRPVLPQPEEEHVDQIAGDTFRMLRWRGSWATVSYVAKTVASPSDILIGRECWRVFGGISDVRVDYRAGGDTSIISREVERIGGAVVHYLPVVSRLERPGSKWRPSIHMPDWAARIRRRVVSVTVERLQDVTIQDAVREGFPTDRHGGTDARNDFLCAWDDIYLNRGLASAVNPWVWRIEFASENVQEVSDGR